MHKIKLQYKTNGSKTRSASRSKIKLFENNLLMYGYFKKPKPTNHKIQNEKLINIQEYP